MAALSKKLRNWRDPASDAEGLHFWCPGCNQAHAIRTKGPSVWGWNGDADRPTFTPSVLVTWLAVPDANEEFKEWRTERRCHSFVNDGRIMFLDDSTHELAGQEVDLPDWPEAVEG